MGRQSLVSEVVDGLFSDITARRLTADDALPSENELSERFDVSRVTIREAVKTLQAQGVVRVESGRGSFVEPLARWTSLSAVLAATTAGEDDAVAAQQLIEVRRMFETGAAALAATRITGHEISELERAVEGMEAAYRAEDVAGFVHHDLAFHDVIIAAARNPFLRVMFEPLTAVLSTRREQTSRVPIIQAHAITEHRNVLDAIRNGDAEQARLKMNDHIDQTLADLRQFVLAPVHSGEETTAHSTTEP